MKQLVVVALALGCKSQPASVVLAPNANARESYTPGTLLSPGAVDACTNDSDCTWGEIDHEILTSKGCMCLVGCPGLAQNVRTESRRRARYMKLCDSSTDAQGRHCSLADCAPPAPIHCTSGKCG